MLISWVDLAQHVDFRDVALLILFGFFESGNVLIFFLLRRLSVLNSRKGGGAVLTFRSSTSAGYAQLDVA
jgi:hypothetical protein